ncbi:unnamed protein product, partial [Ectocarpus sp. 4 AP-2014]
GCKFKGLWHADSQQWRKPLPARNTSSAFSNLSSRSIFFKLFSSRQFTAILVVGCWCVMSLVLLMSPCHSKILSANKKTASLSLVPTIDTGELILNDFCNTALNRL